MKSRFIDIDEFRIEQSRWTRRWNVYLYAYSSPGTPNGGERYWYASFKTKVDAIDFVEIVRIKSDASLPVGVTIVGKPVSLTGNVLAHQ